MRGKAFPAQRDSRQGSDQIGCVTWAVELDAKAPSASNESTLAGGLRLVVADCAEAKVNYGRDYRYDAKRGTMLRWTL
jgi:hypothetical protein